MLLNKFWLFLSEEQLNPVLFEKYGTLVKYTDRDVDEDSNFFLETRCITAWVERLLRQKINTEFWKVIVKCCKYSSNQITNIGDVCTVNVEFDYDGYLQANPLQKKKIALNTLIKALEIVSNEYPEIKMSYFYDICKIIEENNYINSWEWKKAYRKDRKYYVIARACLNMEAFEMNMELYDKAGNMLCSKNAIKHFPEDRLYSHFFGKVKWNSPTEVWLYNKGGKNAVWAAKVDFSDYINIEG